MSFECVRRGMPQLGGADALSDDFVEQIVDQSVKAEMMRCREWPSTLATWEIALSSSVERIYYTCDCIL